MNPNAQMTEAEAIAESRKLTGKTTREVVGREFDSTHFSIHHRKIGTKDWFGGTSRYKTLGEAEDQLKQHGKRYENVGGLVIDTGEAQSVFEYRIVKSVSHYTVMAVQLKKI